MSTVFLSPSQAKSNFIDGGTEQEYMNELADKMAPLLDLAGIQYGRNNPKEDMMQSVALSNAIEYDLHIALYSNAAPEQYTGLFQGPIVYYNPACEQSRSASQFITSGLRTACPNPALPKAMTSTEDYEIRETKAPVVLVKIAYRDNAEDAAWLKSSLEPIAEKLTESIALYLGVLYAEKDGQTQGTVMLHSGSLNMRSAPSVNANKIGSLYNGETVTILSRLPGWHFVEYKGQKGYVSSQYIY